MLDYGERRRDRKALIIRKQARARAMNRSRSVRDGGTRVRVKERGKAIEPLAYLLDRSPVRSPARALPFADIHL